MQQRLVLLVPHAELLQEEMRVPNNLLHLQVVLHTGSEGLAAAHHTGQAGALCAGATLPHLVVGHLQQVQHDLVSSHVLQQPLLLLPHSTAAHLVEPLQDLLIRGSVEMSSGSFSLIKSRLNQTAWRQFRVAVRRRH